MWISQVVCNRGEKQNEKNKNQRHRKTQKSQWKRLQIQEQRSRSWGKANGCRNIHTIDTVQKLGQCLCKWSMLDWWKTPQFDIKQSLGRPRLHSQRKQISFPTEFRHFSLFFTFSGLLTYDKQKKICVIPKSVVHSYFWSDTFRSFASHSREYVS